MNSRRRALPFTVLSTSPAARTPAQQIYRYMRRVSKSRHLLSMNSIRFIQDTRLTEIDDEQSRMRDQDAPIRGYRVSRPQRTRVQRNESNRDMWGGSRNKWEGVVEGEFVAGSGRDKKRADGTAFIFQPRGNSYNTPPDFIMGSANLRICCQPFQLSAWRYASNLPCPIQTRNSPTRLSNKLLTW